MGRMPALGGWILVYRTLQVELVVQGLGVQRDEKGSARRMSSEPGFQSMPLRTARRGTCPCSVGVRQALRSRATRSRLLGRADWQACPRRIDKLGHARPSNGK